MPPLLKIADADSQRTLGRLSHGDRGIDETVGYMFALIEHAANREMIRIAAQDFTLNSPREVYQFVKQSVIFKSDPPGVEMLQVPGRMIRLIQQNGYAHGDCDDSSMLVCALLDHLRWRPVLIVVAVPSKTVNNRFGHIFAGAKKDDDGPLDRANVIPMDSQEDTGYGVWPRPCVDGNRDKCVPRTRIYERNVKAGVQW